MKPTFLNLGFAGLMLTIGIIGLAPTPAAAQSRNHFSVNARIGFNLQAEFENRQSTFGNSNPGSAGQSNIDRSYDDGYVRVDSAGNAGGRTWYWGYQDATQVSGSSIDFHSGALSDLPDAGSDTDVSTGVELVYQRDIRVNGNLRWGVQGAFSCAPAQFSNGAAASGSVVETTDRYSTFGSTLPQAPYNGTFEGPGALIGSDPISRTIQTSQATISSERNLETDMFGVRIGPFASWTVARNFELGVGAGLSIVPTFSTLKYTDTATDPSTGNSLLELSGSGDQNDVLVGGYFEGLVTYRWNENWSVDGSFQYQYLNDSVIEVDGREAQLILSQAFFLSIGVGYRF